MIYQATGDLCPQRDSSAISPETVVALTKGLVEALVYIQAPTRKREVMEILKKNLRLSKDEDVEASYKVARQQMPSLDVAPLILTSGGLFSALFHVITRRFRKLTWTS